MSRNHRLLNLIRSLLEQPEETGWLEFKTNKAQEGEIGQQISALANTAALEGRDRAFLVWGVEDRTHQVVGTSFKPWKRKIGNEQLGNWLSTQLRPRIDFSFQEIEYQGHPCVLLTIEPANHRPVAFKGIEWIRVGSYKKKLKDHPEKEKVLWNLFSRGSFETGITMNDLNSNEVIELIDYPSYFELVQRPLPDEKSGLIQALSDDDLVRRSPDERFQITNLGAILFARDLSIFSTLKRKAVRVIFYKGESRIQAASEKEFKKGYASGFSELINFLKDRLPPSEEIKEALRAEVPLYPEIAVRELVANALIHQDFDAQGAGPMIEVFSDRVEITNPGSPLIDVQRFLDLPPRSRNDKLASLMRRLGICEERGSGVDKVINIVEAWQLPPPDFQAPGDSVRVTLFRPKEFAQTSREERIRACYQHAGLMYISSKRMTNSSLRKRFSISDKNYSMASRIIADTISAGLIKDHDPSNKSKRYAKYIPFWAA